MRFESFQYFRKQLLKVKLDVLIEMFLSLTLWLLTTVWNTGNQANESKVSYLSFFLNSCAKFRQLFLPPREIYHGIWFSARETWTLNGVPTLYWKRYILLVLTTFIMFRDWIVWFFFFFSRTSEVYKYKFYRFSGKLTNTKGH